MKQKKEQLTYTLIIHQIRKKLKLSLMEYCVSDCIYHLSNNPKSEIKGWCFATKETIANILGTTSRNLFDIIPKLIKKGFIEKSEETRGYLRTTQKWYENVVIIRMKAEYEETSHTMKKLHNDYEETSQPTMKKLHTYNNKYKDNYKDTPNLLNFPYKNAKEIIKEKTQFPASLKSGQK